MHSEIREFAADELETAKAFILDLPAEVRRVYVEVHEEGAWRFVYGDDRCHVADLLGPVVRGRPFRIRGFDTVRQIVDAPRVRINPQM